MGSSHQQHMRLVREWKRSGLKAAEFARQKGIKRQALHNWSWQLNKKVASTRGQKRSANGIRLLPVQVTPTTQVFDRIDRQRIGADLSIEIDRDGRVRIEVVQEADLQRVATLIALLRGSPC